jgi:hypothetical protein
MFNCCFGVGGLGTLCALGQRSLYINICHPGVDVSLVPSALPFQPSQVSVAYRNRMLSNSEARLSFASNRKIKHYRRAMNVRLILGESGVQHFHLEQQ